VKASVWSRGRTENRFTLFLDALPLSGALLLSCATLAACAGPMTAREAQGTAATSLRRYCTETAPCGPTRIVQTQRLGPNWLVDFESATARYGVLVHENGATQVSTWKKPS